MLPNPAPLVRKPGLWELTTNMMWQQSPFPGRLAAAGSGTHTMRVCLTQPEIEKYGAVIPTPQGSCQMSNVVRTANGMTGDMVCTGAMNGKAKVQTSWADADHATGLIHFTGTMQIGPAAKTVEWTNTSSSAYKGPECGSVKPSAVLER